MKFVIVGLFCLLVSYGTTIDPYNFRVPTNQSDIKTMCEGPSKALIELAIDSKLAEEKDKGNVRSVSAVEAELAALEEQIIGAVSAEDLKTYKDAETVKRKASDLEKDMKVGIESGAYIDVKKALEYQVEMSRRINAAKGVAKTEIARFTQQGEVTKSASRQLNNYIAEEIELQQEICDNETAQIVQHQQDKTEKLKGFAMRKMRNRRALSIVKQAAKIPRSMSFRRVWEATKAKHSQGGKVHPRLEPWVSYVEDRRTWCGIEGKTKANARRTVQNANQELVKLQGEYSIAQACAQETVAQLQRVSNGSGAEIKLSPSCQGQQQMQREYFEAIRKGEKKEPSPLPTPEEIEQKRRAYEEKDKALRELSEESLKVEESRIGLLNGKYKALFAKNPRYGELIAELAAAKSGGVVTASQSRIKQLEESKRNFKALEQMCPDFCVNCEKKSK